MKKIADLKNVLIGKEFSFVELNSYMMEAGFYSIFDDGITSNIKADKNVVYTSIESGEYEAQIFFKITDDSGALEDDEMFYMLVTDVQEF